MDGLLTITFSRREWRRFTNNGKENAVPVQASMPTQTGASRCACIAQHVAFPEMSVCGCAFSSLA
jgi:hypothetical protein